MKKQIKNESPATAKERALAAYEEQTQPDSTTSKPMNNRNFRRKRKIGEIRKENGVSEGGRPVTIRMAESVLNSIVRTVGSRPAESGGMLLGPPGENSITHFFFDQQGKTSTATYSPSAEALESLCEKAACELGLELKGFVHSHPGLPTPSPGDMEYVRRFFKVNPSMPQFLIPIMPHPPIGAGISGWHEVINFWIVERANPHKYQSAEIDVYADRDRFQEGIFEHLNISQIQLMLSAQDIATGSIDCDGVTVACMTVKVNEVEMMALLPSEFPILPPAIVLTRPGNFNEQAKFHWLLDSERIGEERLAILLQRLAEEGAKTI